MEDYRFNWLQDVIKKLVKNKTETSTYPSQNDDNPLFSVELIIDPVISVFEDYKGTNCMAINLGYNYYYSDIIEDNRINLHTKLDGEILLNLITLISSEYKGNLFAFGFCNDSSYVAFYKRKLMRELVGNRFIQIVSGDAKDELDKYLWVNSMISDPIDSSLIYSIFPKEKVTLPNAEKLKAKEKKLLKLKENEKKEEKKKKETLQREMELKAKKWLDKGKSIKNVILGGHHFVGKTTLVLRYLSDKFSLSTETTDCVDFFLKKISIDNEEYGLFIWDLLGLERTRFLVEFFANNIDGAILCFDLTYPASLDMEEWINIIRKSNPVLPILFLGTKLDLRDDIMIDDDYALSFKEQFNFFDYLKVSSKTGENVEEAFDVLIEKISQQSTQENIDIKLIENKFKLIQYLHSYEIQGKEELQTYLGDDIDDELLEEDWKAHQLLLYPEFKQKVQKFIDNED